VADQLNKRGHSVTVFERSDRVGGLLMYGIPNMKLEKQIVDRKVKVMEAEGVSFVTGTDVGKDVKAEKLLKEFDKVVLACGASNPRDISAPGRDAKGIYFAVDFLKANTKSLLDSNFEDGSFINTKDKNVVIIGGGDTGNDCVGTSIRHGCKSVTQIEMMPKAPDTRAENNPWPEWPKICKTDYGQEEAIALFGHDPRIYESTVKEFVKDKNGNLKAVKIVKLSWEKNPDTGRMEMKEVPGSEQTLPAEIVLIAAGFLGSQKYVTDAFKVELNQRTNVNTAPGQYETNVKNVFTAGDMHRGQSLVVWAIREGREAARAVDESLMGYTNLAAQ
jgi:glutamate synthase (NADPH/NADH) small chain